MSRNKVWEDGEQTPDYEVVDDAADKIKESIQKAGGKGLGANVHSVVGICANCNNYTYAENDIHQIVYSACSGLNFDNPVPIGKHNVKNCTNFQQKGELSIQAMFSIATLIEPGVITGKRRVAGFMSDELKEKKDE